MKDQKVLGQTFLQLSGIVVTVKTHGHTTDKGEKAPRSQQVKYYDKRKISNILLLKILKRFEVTIIFIIWTMQKIMS